MQTYTLRVVKKNGAAREWNAGSTHITAILRATIFQRDPDVVQIVLLKDGTEIARGIS